MQRTIILAALGCALAAGAAHAQQGAGTVATTFSYTDFADRHGNPGAYYLSGAFRGTDSNNDGTIELGELTSLEVQGKQFVGCGANPGDLLNAYCGIARFSFTPGSNKLDFSLKWGNDGEPDFAPSWERDEITTGDKVSLIYIDHRGDESGPLYYWTDATQLSIPAAVPEPAQSAMLLAGLAALGGLARRRRGRRI